MANRSVFCVKESYPYVMKMGIEFEWYPGFAISQKRRCVASLHDAFLSRHEDKKILEVSSYSSEELGNNLSAFHLKKYVASIDKKVPVENVFQSSKKFVEGGPHLDLLNVKPIEAKKDERIRGYKLIDFVYEGKSYPLEPKTIFYDWIYMNALLENEDLIKRVVEYDAFSDIAFNPEKSINCQANTCAKFVSLYRLHKLEEIKEFESFQRLLDVIK